MSNVKTKKSVSFVDEPIAMSDASSSSACKYKLDIATPKNTRYRAANNVVPASSPGGGARLSAGSPASSRHASQDGDNDKAGSSKAGNMGHSVGSAELAIAKLSVKDNASRG